MKHALKKVNKKRLTQMQLASYLGGPVLLLFFVLSSFLFLPSASSAQFAEMETDPNSEGFKLTVCDGPTNGGRINPATKGVDLTKNADGSYKYPLQKGYVPCDFNGIMKQIQHLINIAIILGVIVAILGFSYAGYLYITGSQENIKKAKSIFPKIFGGFIIMLSGWFIVYQVLSWLTGEGSGFGKLLGNP